MRLLLRHRALATLVAVGAALIAVASTVAPADATATDFHPRVFVVGDSLTVGPHEGCYRDGMSCLERAFTRNGFVLSPEPNARVGRSVDEALRIVSATSGVPRRLVFALGTNDYMASAAEVRGWVRSLRARVGPATVVYWVNLDMVGARYSNYALINRTLLTAARADTRALLDAHQRGRTFVCDWHAYAAASRTPHTPDGVHYETAGYARRANFYAGCVAGSAFYLPYRLT